MKRNWKLIQLVVVIGWLASLLLINPPHSYACSCAVPGSVSAELRNSSVVFAGKVTDSESFGALMNGYPQMRYTFQVSEVWKGSVKSTIIVESGMGGGDCGAGFVDDEEYLVYAYGTGPYYTSMCTRTASLSAATEDLDELGEGDIPEPAPPVTGFNMLPLIIASCGAVMLLGFATAFFVYRFLMRRSQSYGD